jgi:cysteine desulfurase/selenocysteine lyase
LEFPANLYPWLNLEQRGVEVKFVEEDEGRIPFDRLAQAIDRRTRVLTISAVQWCNGFRSDLVRLGELCKEKGVLLVVDAIQALGVHPIDVQAMNIDFLAADGHKWLCAPEGAGVFFCRRELVGHLRPTEPGYLCMVQGYDTPQQVRKIDLLPDARRFDSGAYNIAGIAALGASIELLLDTGIETIQKQIKTLTDQLVSGLREIGWRVHSPRTATEWSGIVSFSHEKHDLEQVRQHLQDEFRIIIAHRGGRLRASPHCYNTAAEIEQLLTALPSGLR